MKDIRDAIADSDTDDRQRRIEHVLLSHLQRRAEPDAAAHSDEQFLGQHPDLMPELAEKLRLLRELDDQRALNASFDTAGNVQSLTNALTVRCPNCGQRVKVPEDSNLSDILCSSCGSQFDLVADETMTDASTPARLLGHFQLVEQIGEGSFGVVWKARDTELDRLVAIKIPRRGKLRGSEVEQFLREARAAAQLNHPHIVGVHEVGRDDQTVYIVSDLVQGVPLSDWLTGKSCSFREAAELCMKVALALEHAHQAGVIHRDLKPHNIILDTSGEPFIMDFGLARRDAGEITMTMDGRILGTPAYMSPEQARGEAHHADVRTDVYSLGVILFELLTGELPFRGSTRMMLHQVQHDDAPSPRKLNSAIPKDLETICLKCLEKEPEDRYASARELADELLRFLENRPIHARPISTASRAWRWCRRRPQLAALTVALVTILLLLSIAGPMVAIRQRMLAERATQRLRVSESMRLAAQSQALLENQPVQSALLAVEAVQMTRRHDAAVLPTAREVLLTATSELGGVPLVGHTGWVFEASLSPDDRWLVTGSTDENGPRLWDLTAKKRPFASRVLPHPQANRVAISRDQKWIVTGSDSGSVRLWRLNVADPTESSVELVDRTKLPDRTKQVRRLIISGDSRWAVASFYHREAGVVQAWDLTAKDPKSSTKVFIAHTRPILNAVDVSADGRWLVTGSPDGTALVWDLESEDQTTPELKFNHGAAIGSAAISFDGRWLVTAGDRPRLWDLSTDKPTESSIPLRNQKGVPSIAFSQDNRLLATAGEDGTACLYDLDTADPFASCIVMRGHQGDLKRVVISANGRWLVTCSSDHMVRLWDLKSVQRDSLATVSEGEGPAVKLWSADDRIGSTRLLAGHDDSVFALAITSDSKRLITGGWDGNVRLWHLDSDNPASNRALEGKDDVQALGVTPDGKWLVVGCDGANSRLWDLTTGGTLSSSVHLRGAVDGIGTFVISPDSRWLIATSAVPIYTDEPNYARQEKVARVWDLKADDPGEQAFQLKGHQEAVTSIALSGDGDLVATGSVDRTVRLWDLSTGKGKLVREFTGHGDKVLSVALSASGSHLVTAAYDGTAFLWDLTTVPVVKQELHGHEAAIVKIVISPDDRWVATGSSYEPARVWDLRSPDPLSSHILPGHSSFVVGVAFSPSGQWLATGSWDRKTIVWDLHSTDPFSSPHLVHQNDAVVFSLAFSADSRRLLSGSRRMPRVLNLADPNANATSLALPEKKVKPRAVALTPDGRRAVTAGRKVRLWDLEIEAQLEYAKQLVGRELTAEERKRFLILDD